MATPDPRDKSEDGAGVPARRAALRLLDAVLRRGSPLETALDKAAHGLDPSDRALAHAITAAVLRWLVDLDALIDGATAKPLPADAKARTALRIALGQALVLGTPGHAAIATVLPLVDGGPKRLVHGVFGTLSRSGATLPPVPTLPPEVEARWDAAWSADVVAAAGRSLAGQPPLDLSFKEAEGAAASEGEALAPLHRRLPASTRPTELPGFAEGAFWVQDLAASLPARLLGLGEGRTVVDLCAAPGGKTMQLAAAGWVVTAVDLAEPRLKRLRNNLARTALAADTLVADALTYSPPTLFDAVLLDAPCSATGIFRRHPDVLHRVRPRAIAQLAERQQAMLARAAAAVKPGGALVYAVCSLEPDEGERAIETFLGSSTVFTLDPVRVEELPAGITPDEQGRVRVLPGMLEANGGADGFFIARMRKTAPAS